MHLKWRGGGGLSETFRSIGRYLCVFVLANFNRTDCGACFSHFIFLVSFWFDVQSISNRMLMIVFGFRSRRKEKRTNDMFEWPSDSFEWLMIRLGQDIIRLADDYVYALVRPTELARRISQGAQNQHQHHNRWLNLSHSNPNTLVHVAKETHLDTHSLAHL